MIAESISLLAAIFIHLSIVVTALSLGGHTSSRMVTFIIRVHAYPILYCLIASMLAINGLTISAKVFLSITIIFLGVALLRTWKVISEYFRKLP